MTAGFEAMCAAEQRDAQTGLPTHGDAVMAPYPGCEPSIEQQSRQNGAPLPAVDLGAPGGSVVG